MRTFVSEMSPVFRALVMIFIPVALLITQTGCYGTKDVSRFPTYASHLRDRYRTTVDFAIIGTATSPSKFCRYLILPAVQIYDNELKPPVLRSSFGGDKVYGVLSKNSTVEIERFINEWSVDNEMTYPIVKVIDKGPFENWELMAFVLNKNKEAVMDPEMATAIQSATVKTQASK